MVCLEGYYYNMIMLTSKSIMHKNNDFIKFLSQTIFYGSIPWFPLLFGDSPVNLTDWRRQKSWRQAIITLSSRVYSQTILFFFFFIPSFLFLPNFYSLSFSILGGCIRMKKKNYWSVGRFALFIFFTHTENFCLLQATHKRLKRIKI